MGRVRFEYRQAVEREIKSGPDVRRLLGDDAERVRREVVAIAPVKTGEYRSSVIVAVERSSDGYIGRTYARAPYSNIVEWGAAANNQIGQAPMRHGLIKVYGGPLLAG